MVLLDSGLAVIVAAVAFCRLAATTRSAPLRRSRPCNPPWRRGWRGWRKRWAQHNCCGQATSAAACWRRRWLPPHRTTRRCGKLTRCCVHLSRFCSGTKPDPSLQQPPPQWTADSGCSCDDGKLVTAAVRRAMVAQTSRARGPGRRVAASLDYSFEGQDEREYPTIVMNHPCLLSFAGKLLLSSLSSPPCLPHSPPQVASHVKIPVPFANSTSTCSYCLLACSLFRAWCCFRTSPLWLVVGGASCNPA